MNSWIDLGALGKIVLGSLICGALLPAIFAIGLRALHMGAPASVRTGTADPSVGPSVGPSGDANGSAASDRVVGGNPVGIALAVICFAVVLAAIGWGIDLIVASS